MIGLKIRTEGVEGLGLELLEETRRDLLGPVARAAEKLERRMKQKLACEAGRLARVTRPRSSKARYGIRSDAQVRTPNQVP